MGLQPPDMATASQLMCMPLVRCTDFTALPPTASATIALRMTGTLPGSACESLRLSMIASTWMPWDLRSRAVR